MAYSSIVLETIIAVVRYQLYSANAFLQESNVGMTRISFSTFMLESTPVKWLTAILNIAKPATATFIRPDAATARRCVHHQDVSMFDS